MIFLFVLIGPRNAFGFGFTPLNRKALYVYDYGTIVMSLVGTKPKNLGVDSNLRIRRFGIIDYARRCNWFSFESMYAHGESFQGCISPVLM